MNKRLRKKKHLGEYAEWGRELEISRNAGDGFDDFMDIFIEEAIGANGCYCGGGGSAEKLSFVIELGRTCDDPNGRTKNIEAWLDARNDVRGYRIGPVFDLWHGDSSDIDEETPL